jgi:hypothetical protein
MKWIKKGFIFKPNGQFEWSKGYAQIPRPLVLKDRIRVFYATRYYDSNSLPISQTSFIDIDKKDLTKVLYVKNQVSLDLGKKSSFAEHGIHPTMLIKNDDKTFLFYQGWKRLLDFPYETAIGIAESCDDGLTFKKLSENPVFEKSEEDPFFVNGAFIYPKDGEFIMYYSGGIKWIESEEKKESVYVIKMALSKDLFHWTKVNNKIILGKTENECQNTPCIIKINDLYHMWFSYRPAVNFRNETDGYRIGYAYSKDLYNWTRNDENAGIDVSERGNWDSEMNCYPYVLQLDDRIIMLYCGNYFGKEGFGYAELEL